MATKRLTNSQLMAWVYTPAATVQKLQQCYAHYGLAAPVPGNLGALKTAIYNHVNGLALPNAVAAWQPTVATRPTRNTPVRSNTSSAHSILNTTLAPATEGLAYSHNFVANGYANPVSFTIVGAPAWLQINAVTGNLTSIGTVPTGACGYHRFNVQATDGITPSTAPVTLTVNASTAPVATRPTRTGRQFPLWILPVALLIALLALLWFFGPRLMSLLPVAPVATTTPVAAPTAAPSGTVILDALKYDEMTCDPANLPACMTPGQTQFPAVFVRNIQSADKTLTEGIVAIQQQAALAGVPSFDKWTTLTADAVRPMFVWCPGNNCQWIPDTAFPLLGVGNTNDDYTIGIIQAHYSADPKATVLNVVCPNGDCWAIKLK